MIKPTKEYMEALIGESIAISKEYVAVKLGRKRMTGVEREEFNKRKDYVLSEIQRVKELI